MIDYLRNPRQRNPRPQKSICRPTQLLNLLRRENMRPLLRVVAVILRLPHGGARDFLGEILVGFEQVVFGSLLSDRFESVRENFSWD